MYAIRSYYEIPEHGIAHEDPLHPVDRVTGHQELVAALIIKPHHGEKNRFFRAFEAGFDSYNFV